MLQVMGAVAQFELAMIKERQKEGIAIAQKKGTKIGRSAKLTEKDIPAVKEMLSACQNKKQIAADLGVSRPTFYAFLREYQL
jgi:DNA invertase Pin-like site-specific DNA recombinase